jgi:uncharacterized protein
MRGIHMTVNVSGILKVYGEKIDIDCGIDLHSADFLGEQYVFLTPVKVKGTVSNNGQALELKACASGTMRVQCARCCKELDVDVEFPVEEILAQDDGTVSDEDDVVVFEGNDIDLDDIVLNNFLMNVQGKYLCKEDCKGLCPKCGKDLNEGSCSCEEDIDPRWAGLAQIMKESTD